MAEMTVTRAGDLTPTERRRPGVTAASVDGMGGGGGGR